jgi:hypothetical protein
VLDRAAPLTLRYDEIVRVLLIFTVACSAPVQQPAAQPQQAPATRDEVAIAEPPPKQAQPAERPIDPNDPSGHDEWLLRNMEHPPRVPIVVRRYNPPDEVFVGSSDLWSPCVKDFVYSRSDDARRALTAAFGRYVVTCDSEKRVVIAPPHEYLGKSTLSFTGTFAGSSSTVMLRVTTCSATTLEQIVVVYDGKRWTSPQLNPEPSTGGCVGTSLPISKTVRRMVRDLSEAREAIVLFDTEEVFLSDDMKRDLQLMLDALDALASP